MFKRICALALCIALMCTSAWAQEGGFTLSPRSQAIRAAEQGLLETYGLTQPMLCYFVRKTDKTENGWSFTYSGVEVFGYVLGVYTVQVADGKAECSWSWDGVEPEGFGAAPWGSAQLQEVCDYVRTYSTYAAYFQMAEALKLQAGVTEEDWDSWSWLPEGDGVSIAPQTIPMGLDAMLAIGHQAVSELWGLTEEQKPQLSGTELEPDYRRIDGEDCIVIYYHFGTKADDPEPMENVHPDWMEKAGTYALALSLKDGTIMDLRYDADLRGNG